MTKRLTRRRFLQTSAVAGGYFLGGPSLSRADRQPSEAVAEAPRREPRTVGWYGGGSRSAEVVTG